MIWIVQNGKWCFCSIPNNPSIEIIPIRYEGLGQWISLQAKYFSTVDYSKIKYSAKNAIQGNRVVM